MKMRINRLALRPDLNECVLEDRNLLAYSPSVPGFIYASSGFIVLTVPPGLSSALNSAPSGGGSSFSSNGSGGGTIGTSFSINGFGPSSIQIGNNTGFAALAAGAGSKTTAAGGSAGPGGIAGSTTGASGTTAQVAGYSSSFSSGNNTALNSSNNFGQTTSPVGSVPAPVQTYADSSSSTPVLQQTNSTADANANINPPQMSGVNPLGGPSLTEGLLGKKLRTTTSPMPFAPSISNPNPP
jgi:hypothetical protein